MSKRYLCDLERDELEKVIEVNHKLYDELVDYYYEDEDFWVSEAMKYLTVDDVISDYNISPHQVSYINFKEDKALTSLGNMNNYRHAFDVNSERFNTKLDRALEYLTFYEQSFNLFHDPIRPYDDYIKNIQNKVMEITYDTIWEYVKELSNLLVEHLLRGYSFNNDTIIEALERKYIEHDPHKVYVKDDSYIAYYEESYEI